MDMDVFEKLEAKIDELVARQAEQSRLIEVHQAAMARKEEEIASLKNRLEAADQERNLVKARIDGLLAKIDSYADAAEAE
jgi:FtsZ-binding cell division protein ZapB